MNPTSKTLPFIAALGAASLLAMPVALAQAPRSGGDDWPARPVRFIVPFAPGAANDLIARAVGSKLADIWGQSVLVDNRPGGGTVIGSDLVARSPADGYTLLQIGLAHAVNPSVIAKLPYDSLRDFTMVAQTGESPFVMVSNVSLPVKNVRELAALARKNPGKLNYASSGAGTVGHLAMELLTSMNGGSYVHVPYKGSGQAITDVVGGYVILMAASMPVFVSHVQAGKLKPLGVTSAKRSRALPDVPTISEQGFPGYEVSSGFGMLAPANVSPTVIKTINGALVKAIQDPAVRDRLSSQGAEPVGSTPEQHDQLVRSEIARWTKIVKQVGIKVDGS